MRKLANSGELSCEKQDEFRGSDSSKAIISRKQICFAVVYNQVNFHF